jgi:hypothetical protein
MSWNDLESMCRKVKTLQDAGRLHRHEFANAIIKCDAAQVVGCKDFWKWLSFDTRAGAMEFLLSTFHHMRSTDTRDRVWALYGLVRYLHPETMLTEHDDFAIDIDCAMSIEEVFVNVYHSFESVGFFSGRNARLKFIGMLEDIL